MSIERKPIATVSVGKAPGSKKIGFNNEIARVLQGIIVEQSRPTTMEKREQSLPNLTGSFAERSTSFRARRTWLRGSLLLCRRLEVTLHLRSLNSDSSRSGQTATWLASSRVQSCAREPQNATRPSFFALLCLRTFGCRPAWKFELHGSLKSNVTQGYTYELLTFDFVSVINSPFVSFDRINVKIISRNFIETIYMHNLEKASFS